MKIRIKSSIRLSKFRLIEKEIEEEVLLSIQELALKRGFLLESHRVVTEDGYLLTLHRIPYGRSGPAEHITRPRPAVLLMHGLTGTSCTWLHNEPDNGLAYLLADAGFDVWLGNMRGNAFSREHSTLRPECSARDRRDFWNFSIDEVARYDLPVCIDYIIQTTGNAQLSYIGHSMGAMVAFMCFSRNLATASKVNLLIGIAPVARISNVRGLIGLAANQFKIFRFAHKLLLNGGEALPTAGAVDRSFLLLIGNRLTNRVFLAPLLYLLLGQSSTRVDRRLFPALSAPGAGAGGTSRRMLVHLAQCLEKGTFANFDFGKQVNKRLYLQETLPEFNLSSFPVNVALYWSQRDWLASENNINWLLAQLPKERVLFSHCVDDYSHMDFLWARDARSRIYNKIVDHLSNF